MVEELLDAGGIEGAGAATEDAAAAAASSESAERGRRRVLEEVGVWEGSGGGPSELGLHCLEMEMGGDHKLRD